MTRILKSKKKPGRLFDYKRSCDRCGGTVFLRSDLQVEQQTQKLVCEHCLDKPSYDDNLANFKMVNRNFKFE